MICLLGPAKTPGTTINDGYPAAAPRRTLILTSDPAFPPVSGGDLRNYQNALAAAQFGPVLLVSVNPSSDPAPPPHGIQTAALTRKDEPRAPPLTRWRSSVEVRVARPALPRLLTLVHDFQPDTIIVEGIPLAALLDHLRPLAPRLILDMHNVESDLAAQIGAAAALPGKLIFAWSDQGRIQRLERRALSVVDRVWVCSDVDREKLASLFAIGIPVHVVPNGVPRFDEITAEPTPVPGKEQGFPVMLFVGHLAYEPNIAAAERLVLNILPKVRQTLPSARVLLAGRRPARQVQKLARLAGVELMADPHDLSAVFRRSHLCVIPLTAGGGTRIKILEAMARGLPVVATPIAAEGQGFTDGEEIALADTDAGLADRIGALCADRDRLDRQRLLAHERVRLRFGPRAISDAVRLGFGLSDAHARP